VLLEALFRKFMRTAFPLGQKTPTENAATAHDEAFTPDVFHFQVEERENYLKKKEFIIYSDLPSAINLATRAITR